MASNYEYDEDFQEGYEQYEEEHANDDELYEPVETNEDKLMDFLETYDEQPHQSCFDKTTQYKDWGPIAVQLAYQTCDCSLCCPFFGNTEKPCTQSLQPWMK